MTGSPPHSLRAPVITLLVVGMIFLCIVVPIFLFGWVVYHLSNPDSSLSFATDVGPNIRSFVEASSISGGDVSILVDLPDLGAQVFTIKQCGALCDNVTTYYGIVRGNKIGFLVDYIYVDSTEYDGLILYDFDQADTGLYTDEFIAESIKQKGSVSRYDDFLLYSLARDENTPWTVLHNIASDYYDDSTDKSIALDNELALVLIQHPIVRADNEILALIATHEIAQNGSPDARIQALQLLDFQLPEEDLIVLRDTFRMEGVQALQDALIAREVDLIGNNNVSSYPTGQDLEAALVPEYLNSIPVNPITGEKPHYAWYPANDPEKMQVWTELETHQDVLDDNDWGTKANLDTTQPGWAGDTTDATIEACTPAPNDCVYDLSSLAAFMNEL